MSISSNGSSNRFLIFFVLLGFVFLSQACKKKSSPSAPTAPTSSPQSTTIAKLGPKTIILSSASNQNFLGTSGSNNEIFQYNTTPELANLVPGNIIIGSTGVGYIRNVVSLTNIGGVVTIQTTPAKLDEAFDTLMFNVTQPVTFTTTGASASKVYNKAIINLNNFTIPLGNVKISAGDSGGDSGYIYVNGSFALTNGQIDAVCDLEGGHLNELKFIYTTTMSETASFSTYSGGYGLTATSDFGNVPITPIVVWIPIAGVPIPFMLTPKVNFFVQAEFTVDMVCPSLVHQDDFKIGLWYKNGVKTTYCEKSNSSSYGTAPQFTGPGYASLFGGVEGDLLIDDLVGPYVTIAGGPKLDFSTTNSYAGLDLCLQGTAGIDVNLFDAFSTKWEVANPEICSSPIYDWITFPSVTPTPTITVTPTLPLGSPKWITQVGNADLTALAIANGNIYFAGRAIDLTGVIKWSSWVWDSTTSAAIGSDGTIYTPNSQFYYASNSSGVTLWSIPSGGYNYYASSSGVGGDGTIYTVMGQINPYASGRGFVNYYLQAISSSGVGLWTLSLGGILNGYGFNSAPSIDSNGVIYVGSVDGNLYAVNANGVEKWAYSTGQEIESSPAIGNDGTIYVGSDNGLIYALNPNDGTPKWIYTTGGAVQSSPAIDSGGNIYIGSDDNSLYAINSSGTKLWSYATGGAVQSSPAISNDGTIYFGSNDNNLYALNTSGIKVWSYTSGGPVQSSPAIGNDGTIYFGSNDGYLHALVGSGTLAISPWPKFHKNNSNTGQY